MRERAAGGSWTDLALYTLSAVFAWWTAGASTLAPHRAWGAVAAPGYATAAVLTATALIVAACRPLAGRVLVTRPLVTRPLVNRWRAGLALAVWLATCLAPLLAQAAQRAEGRLGRAQEEVLVIESGGQRLLDSGTPYLDRADIAQLPDQLLGYLPYQPAMATFGLPRAFDSGAAWWSDARIWFALVTVAAMAAVVALLGGLSSSAVIRGVQAVAVLPIATLTLATGGDDLPVLALSLLAFALTARGRAGSAGIAIGAAAALKLFAWPIAAVLAAYYLTKGRSQFARFVLGAAALPIVTALPALLLNGGAMRENVIAFPFGHGLVATPAASPLPGHLIATAVPGGRTLALALLGVAALMIIALLVRRPPGSAAAAAAFSGWVLLTATLLLPATRFGYLLYPAVLLAWAPALWQTRAR